MWPAIIAVLGTLAGGALTFLYQNYMAKQGREEARRDRLRTEFLEACSELAGALIAYRHSQLARQKQRLGVRSGDAAELTDEVRLRRGDAWTARYRVEILTSDELLLDAVRQSMRSIRALKQVQNPAQLDEDAKGARQLIGEFVRRARQRLEDPVSPVE